MEQSRAARPSIAAMKLATTSSMYTRGKLYAGSRTSMGRPFAMLWQNVASNAVVGRAAPFAEHARQAVHQRARRVARLGRKISSSASRLLLP